MKAVLNLLASAWARFRTTRFYSMETAEGVLEVLIFPIGCVYTWHYFSPSIEAPSSRAVSYVKGNMVLPVCFALLFGIRGVFKICRDHRGRDVARL